MSELSQIATTIEEVVCKLADDQDSMHQDLASIRRMNAQTLEEIAKVEALLRTAGIEFTPYRVAK